MTDIMAHAVEAIEKNLKELFSTDLQNLKLKVKVQSSLTPPAFGFQMMRQKLLFQQTWKHFKKF